MHICLTERPVRIQKIKIKKIINLPANATCILFLARKICTYCGTSGAKSLIANDRKMLCSSFRLIFDFTKWFQEKNNKNYNKNNKKVFLCC